MTIYLFAVTLIATIFTKGEPVERRVNDMMVEIETPIETTYLYTATNPTIDGTIHITTRCAHKEVRLECKPDWDAMIARLMDDYSRKIEANLLKYRSGGIGSYLAPRKFLPDYLGVFDRFPPERYSFPALPPPYPKQILAC